VRAAREAALVRWEHAAGQESVTDAAKTDAGGWPSREFRSGSRGFLLLFIIHALRLFDFRIRIAVLGNTVDVLRGWRSVQVV
jgi:hypothetical protein